VRANRQKTRKELDLPERPETIKRRARTKNKPLLDQLEPRKLLPKWNRKKDLRQQQDQLEQRNHKERSVTHKQPANPKEMPSWKVNN